MTLEGPDGSGKTTQCRLLASALRKEGFRVVHTREPGGVSFAEALRRVLLNPRHRIHPVAELLLYEAGRAQHTREVIRPALASGKIVLCERYADASLAYQGYGRGLPLSDIRRLNRIATGGLKPDLTIVLDGGHAIGRRADRMERAGRAFQRRVSAGYRALARREPDRFRIVPARGAVEELHRRILREVRSLL